ncbi:hypothetical protein RUM44_009870 [Polyplax serrata]|uniref:Uncharacterized protein n=1 Tax=Polyplax serrata TaxID=468196 RepID=A0ABR1AU78_POLSC
MEQNQVSDEELIQKLNEILNESREGCKRAIAEVQRQEDSLNEKFHDVYETPIQEDNNNSSSSNYNNPDSDICDVNGDIGAEKNLELENKYLSLQLQAEKKKAKELQTKFKLFENSVKYFERLNGQLETIKRAVDEDLTDIDKADLDGFHSLDTMQKIRPKTVHTAASGAVSNVQDGTENFSEPPPEEQNKSNKVEEKEEITFRDAEDFKLLEQGLEIVKDKNNEYNSENEKVFITKTEKRCLEDIGNLAAKTRTPIDDKHQRFFEKDRRKFANSIAMPDIQEVDKTEPVPPEIISKTNETPVNITSTELDGLRSYLLQLKELIARRETAWARTTERDYNQRVEITRLKNEVGRLRMLCEKRNKDVKEREQTIATKDEEIKDLQKRVQGLKNAVVKLEKKDERFMDTLDGMASEALENSQIVERSYNAMKRQSLINRSNASSNLNIPHSKPSSTKTKDPTIKKVRPSQEKVSSKRGKSYDGVRLDEDDWKSMSEKSKQKTLSKDKPRSRNRTDFIVSKTTETYQKVDEKLQRVEEMLHNEVLKEARKGLRLPKSQTDGKHFGKSVDKMAADISFKKLTPSNSTIRQEMLTAMTGLNPGSNMSMRGSVFPDAKKNQGSASIIANAVLASRNPYLFNY